jgi:hypothetical protein
LKKEDFVWVGTPAYENIGCHLFKPEPPTVVLVVSHQESVATFGEETPLLVGVAQWQDTFFTAGWRPIDGRVGGGSAPIPRGQPVIAWKSTGEGAGVYVVHHQLYDHVGWRPKNVVWQPCAVEAKKPLCDELFELLQRTLDSMKKAA